MQSHTTKFTLKVKREEHGFSCSTFPDHLHNITQEPINVSCSTFPDHLHNITQEPINVTCLEEEEGYSAEDEENQSSEDAQKQLVVYDPAANGTGEIEAVPDPIENQPPSFQRNSLPFHSSRVLPSVGAFTVQCANCFKWRLIPTKEKYEEIREHILEQPFFCETAREWRPEISCEDPPDIYQDGSRLWAIDKPNIAQPPPGWQRLLRIRGEGGTKFADVYYAAPTGKKLRSMVEVQKYLLEHPECVEAGVTMSQFSFQVPRPLQENYVRKRPARTTVPNDGTNTGMPKLLEPSDVNPLAWAVPDETTDLRLGWPRFSTPSSEGPSPPEFVNRPAKKQARRAPSKETSTNNKSENEEHNRLKVEGEPLQPRYGSLDL